LRRLSTRHERYPFPGDLSTERCQPQCFCGGDGGALHTVG
jgi:hypothetical protein